MLNNSWKTALIAVAASVATIGGIKAIDGFSKDVVLNEASSDKGILKLANLPAGQPGDFVYAASISTPAVVHIKAQSKRQVRQLPSIFDGFFGGGMDEDVFGGQRPQNQESSGSGVIISEDGYIVTNNHVVDGADKLEVVTSNKKTYSATVVGTDPNTDIAVIKINEKKLPTMAFANSDDVKVGEWVLAVGNPFNLESTVTAGIVSAIGRNINIIGQEQNQMFGAQQKTSKSKDAGNPIESFIQTDAAVNPGNSGGALVNLNGNLIGINTAIASPNGAYAGYAFAVPSSIVKKVSADLIKFGNVQRGFLGINPVELDTKNAKEFKSKLDEGIYVFETTEDGAAKSAGVKKGDVIVKVDGYEAKSMPKFMEMIGRKHPGEKVNLTINRDGNIKEIGVILKNSQGGEGIVKKDLASTSAFGKLGIGLEDISAQTKTEIGITNGVKIANIDPKGSFAQENDVQEGFIITRVGSKKVNTAKEVKEAVEAAKKNGETGVLICGVYEGLARNYCFGVTIE